MTEHHRIDRPIRRHGGRRGPSVQHADLTHELARTESGSRLASPRDLHVAGHQNEEGIRRLAFSDQRLPRLQVDLVHPAGQELEIAFGAPGKQRHLG